jgi:glycosyltransferase involved in cell wall biosynthesis
MMKNIVFLNSCPVWGGGEKWTFTTAKALAKDPEYKVYIATGRDTELARRSAAAGLEVQPVNIKSGITVLNFVKTYRFVKFLQTKQIDIMFLNMSQDLKFGGITGKLANLDKVIYRRGSAIPIKNRIYNRYLLKNCITNIIANSRATKATILEHTFKWLNEDKIEIIYNGINLNKIDQAFARPVNLRQEFKIARDKIIIGNIGRLSYQKGHEFLIEAVELLKEKRNDFVVLVIGNGERENELKNLVFEKDLNKYIKFTGFRDDIYNILPGLDFLLHTARWEGFGFVIAEAMAAKLPVVSTDVSNISEIVIDNRTGFLAHPGDPFDIAKQSLKMITSNNKKKFGHLGRKVIEDKFTVDRMLRQVKQLISN